MRETHQPPTTSTAGPPHDHTPGATALLPPSTEIDTIRQSPTNHNENSCAHAREAFPPVIPAKAGIYPLHIRPTPIVIPAATHRTIKIAFDKTEPAYYSGTMITTRNHNPRRQPHARNTPTSNHLHRRPSARPHSRSDGPPPAVDGNRHNPTESDEPQRKLVRARARGVPSRHSREGGNPFSRHGNCPQVAADSPYRSELPSPNRHANRSDGTGTPLCKTTARDRLV